MNEERPYYMPVKTEPIPARAVTLLEDDAYVPSLARIRIKDACGKILHVHNGALHSALELPDRSASVSFTGRNRLRFATKSSR